MGAIEFGFAAPVLLAMVLGVLDFGMAYWEQMQVASAADAGAEWAMQNGFNQTSITTVAQSSTPLSSVAVSPACVCGCVDQTTNTISQVSYSSSSCPSCSGTCPSGGTPQNYVVVNTHICYATIFTWPGLTYCSSGDSNCSSCSGGQIALTSQSVVLK